MTTLVNHAIFLQAPKGVIPDIAAVGKNPEVLNSIGQFFQACAGGMNPGLPGDTFISVGKGSSSAALAYAYALMTFATCPAATVIEVNGERFTAFAGATGGTGTFSISGADAADATAFCAAVMASTSSRVLGQARACNMAGTIALSGVAAGETVTINGRTYTATVRSTGVIGDYNIAGSDTADGDALAAANNADPGINKLVVAINAAGTVTVRQLSGTVGLVMRKIGAGITLGGLTGGKLAAVAVAVVSSLIPGTMGNSLSVVTRGIAASATLTVLTAVVTNTVLVNGVTFTAIKQRATGTLTAATAVVGNTFSVGGILFTGVAGASGVGKPNNFSVDTSNNAVAADIVTQINAHPSLALLVKATASAAVVTIRAINSGTAGNSIALTGTAITLAASATTLLGGIAVANNEFDVSPGATDDQVAVDLARAINASTTVLISSYVRAQRTAAAVVTVYSIIPGTPGNGIPLSTTGGTITASATRLAAGAIGDTEGVQASCTLTLTSVLNGQTVTINGVVYTAHTNTQANDQFSIAGTDAQDADALALAINNSSTAGSAELIATTAGTNVVTVKARRGGIAGNLITVAVSAGTVVIGGAAVSGRLGGGAVPTMVVPATDRLAGGVGGDASAPTTWSF